jgi:hypothetical protein
LKIKNILYIDILGYKEKINTGDKSELKKLMDIIKYVINSTQETMTFLKKSERRMNIEMKILSDNFIFWTEKEFDALILMTAGMQTQFYIGNLFIRGSLSYGDLYIDNEYISGKGLINAYELESEIAIFPRVIIENTFFDGASEITSQLAKKEISDIVIINSLLDCFCNDFDSYRFLDYLSIIKKYKDVEIKHEPEKSIRFEELLSAHAENIILNLKNMNRKFVQKYQWCRSYHNEFCKRYKYNDYIITEKDFKYYK